MNNNLWLKIFRSIGIVFFVIVFLLIVYFIKIQQYEAVVKLLVPFGVLISAFVASYSVMVSIDNAKNIENKKQKNELVNEIDMLKLKTSILKHSLSIYFADKKHYKEALQKSNISDDCIHSRDMSNELIDKLDNYEQFIDAKVRILLNKKDIFKILKEIIQNITIVRPEEKFKKEPQKKGYAIRVSVEWALVDNLEKLENKLEILSKEEKGT